MILRKLTLTRFAALNPGLSIPDFHEQITVIFGPNEAGKSTLLKGILFALYQKHGLSGDAVHEEIVPAGTSLGPRTELVIELQGRTWRITKQFVRSPSSLLEEAQGGSYVPVAEGDAADDRLRDLLGATFPGRGLAGVERRGMGEILIADQGRLRFQSTLGEPAKERLRTVVETVATTEGAAGLFARVEERMRRVFTEKQMGVKKDSRLAELRREFETLEAELAVTRDLERRAAEHEATILGIEAQGQDDVGAEKALDGQLEAVNTQAIVVTRMNAERKTLEEKLEASRAGLLAAEGKLDEIARRRAEIARGREESQAAEAALARENQTRDREDAAVRAAEADREALQKDERAVLDAETAANEAAAALVAAAEAKHLGGELDRYRTLAERVAEIGVQLRGKARPTPEEIRSIRANTAGLLSIEGELAALRLRIRIKAERALTLRSEASDTNLKPGEETAIEGDDPLLFAIPGLATFEVRGPSLASRDELQLQQSRLAAENRNLVGPFGTSDLVVLEALQDERLRLEAELKATRLSRDAIFATDVLRDAAALKLSAAATKCDVLLAAHPEWRGAVPSEAHVAMLVDAAQSGRKRCDADRATRARFVKDRQEAAAAARAAASTAEALAATRREKVAKLQGALDQLEADGFDDAGRAAWIDAARSAVTSLATGLGRLSQEIEALGDPGAAVERIESERRRIAEERRNTSELLGRAKNALEEIRNRSIHEEAGRQEERLEELKEARNRAMLDADALALLHRTLAEEQKKSLDLVLEPVTRKVGRLLQAITGRAVSAGLDAGLLPRNVRCEDGPDIEVEQLSAGTQDQLALAARIALAEVYAAKAGRHVLILDDPLVNSDDTRRRRIIEILNRSTRDLQIVILTCHPEHYRGLAAEKTSFVSIADARTRSDGGSAGVIA